MTSPDMPVQIELPSPQLETQALFSPEQRKLIFDEIKSMPDTVSGIVKETVNGIFAELDKGKEFDKLRPDYRFILEKLDETAKARATEAMPQPSSAPTPAEPKPTIEKPLSQKAQEVEDLSPKPSTEPEPNKRFLLIKMARGIQQQAQDWKNSLISTEQLVLPENEQILNMAETVASQMIDEKSFNELFPVYIILKAYYLSRLKTEEYPTFPLPDILAESESINTFMTFDNAQIEQELTKTISEIEEKKRWAFVHQEINKLIEKNEEEKTPDQLTDEELYGIWDIYVSYIKNPYLLEKYEDAFPILFEIERRRLLTSLKTLGKESLSPPSEIPIQTAAGKGLPIFRRDSILLKILANKSSYQDKFKSEYYYPTDLQELELDLIREEVAGEAQGKELPHGTQLHFAGYPYHENEFHPRGKIFRDLYYAIQLLEKTTAYKNSLFRIGLLFNNLQTAIINEDLEMTGKFLSPEEQEKYEKGLRESTLQVPIPEMQIETSQGKAKFAEEDKELKTEQGFERELAKLQEEMYQQSYDLLKKGEKTEEVMAFIKASMLVRQAYIGSTTQRANEEEQKEPNQLIPPETPPPETSKTFLQQVLGKAS